MLCLNSLYIYLLYLYIYRSLSSLNCEAHKIEISLAIALWHTPIKSIFNYFCTDKCTKEEIEKKKTFFLNHIECGMEWWLMMIDNFQQTNFSKRKTQNQSVCMPNQRYGANVRATFYSRLLLNSHERHRRATRWNWNRSVAKGKSKPNESHWVRQQVRRVHVNHNALVWQPNNMHAFDHKIHDIEVSEWVWAKKVHQVFILMEFPCRQFNGFQAHRHCHVPQPEVLKQKRADATTKWPRLHPAHHYTIMCRAAIKVWIHQYRFHCSSLSYSVCRWSYRYDVTANEIARNKHNDNDQ